MVRVGSNRCKAGQIKLNLEDYTFDPDIITADDPRMNKCVDISLDSKIESTALYKYNAGLKAASDYKQGSKTLFIILAVVCGVFSLVFGSLSLSFYRSDSKFLTALFTVLFLAMIAGLIMSSIYASEDPDHSERLRVIEERTQEYKNKNPQPPEIYATFSKK